MLDSLPEDYAQLYRSLEPIAGEGLRLCEGLGGLTSFRIGGPADLFLDPGSFDIARAALSLAHDLGVPVTVIGGGSNLLVSDRGVRGLVMRLGRAFDYIRWRGLGDERAVAEVGAATRMARLVHDSVAKGYKGLEFAAGIPGMVGGATLMNAGAFGGEIGSAVTELQALSIEGAVVNLSAPELDFSYRKLALDGVAVVTSIRFGLLRASVGRLREVVETVQRKRKRRQPVGLPNAGSVFKNPPNGFAGQFIENAGVKGKVVGAAQVSPEHANFIVNLGGATAENVRTLMGLVQEEVWKKCGVWLEPELRLIGDWGET